MKVTVLLSLGRHPKSGRPMLAPNDARIGHREKIDDRRLVQSVKSPSSRFCVNTWASASSNWI